MGLSKDRVKMPLGMRDIHYWPITGTVDGSKFEYGPAVNLGAAVKGYLTITTNSATISGDDITLLDAEMFAGAQLDTETTLSELAVNAMLFGHHFDEGLGEMSRADVSPKEGGISFVEPILCSDKSLVYRVTCLPRCSAIASSEKQEADTRKAGELTPKMNAVSFKVLEDGQRIWRVRKDFSLEDEAAQYIKDFFGAG